MSSEDSSNDVVAINLNSDDDDEMTNSGKDLS